MGNSYMEMIYLDGDDARQTNMRRAETTDAATWRAFNSYRRYAVDIKQATFLLDYHNRKGDLGDTIPIGDAGFTAITGSRPKSAADYRKIDRDFWDEVTRERKAA
jgi:hypothetical protein